MRTAIVGGGAAGFFLAVNLKEMVPDMEVTIFERGQRVLGKVEVSGGGRCNCTNTFRNVSDLSQVYPRGHRLMKRLFHQFGPADAFRWFQEHGVPLVVQPDECVFPQAQDSHVVMRCFTDRAQRYGVKVVRGCRIDSLDALADYDFVAVTTGGSSRAESWRWLSETGHSIEPPVPSLFSLSVPDERLRALMGLVTHCAVQLPGTKFRADGPLLITHWGMSGPAILRLSSYAARHLAQHDYACPLSISWLALSATEAADALRQQMAAYPQRQLSSAPILSLQQRLWAFLAERALGGAHTIRWGALNTKQLNRLVNTLTNDVYQVNGRAPFKDEFVTCGGVSLQSVNPSTLESRHRPHLYFAGEVLDIDGVTGGFNFQAAWTTAYVAACSIRDAVS